MRNLRTVHRPKVMAGLNTAPEMPAKASVISATIRPAAVAIK
ncbi:MAG: hypothetical protein WDN27_06670 [Candidatus Saccharibacteria bacterium]